jgi:hypothetical protein
MDEAGDQALARAGLALQEDGGEPAARVLAAGKPADGLPHGFHRRALPQELAPGIHRAARITQKPLLVK